MSLPPDTPTQPPPQPETRGNTWNSPAGLRMRTVLPLTDGQRAALEPLFEGVQAANRRGEAAAIAAQVYRDGIVVALLSDAQCATWEKNTREAGLPPLGTSGSAAERTGDGS